MKRCSKCRQTKPKIDFSRDTRNKNGLCNACKQCNSVRNKLYLSTQENKNKQSALHSKRLREKPLLKTQNSIKAIIYKILVKRWSYKNHKIWDYIQLSLEDLNLYLGDRPKGYQLGHKVPLCLAKTEEDLWVLQHYTNLRYVSKKDNCSKGYSLLPEFKELAASLLASTK